MFLLCYREHRMRCSRFFSCRENKFLLLLYNKRLFQGRKLYWLIICLTQTAQRRGNLFAHGMHWMTQNFAPQVSAKVCAVCVRQSRSAWFCVFREFCVRPIPLRMALVKIRAISGSKNTCRYTQIRGEILCIPCFLCETTSRRLLRRFAKLCAFAWEEYVLLSRIIAHRTHRNTQN